MLSSFTHATWDMFHLISCVLLTMGWAGAFLWCRRGRSIGAMVVVLLLVALLDTTYQLADQYTGEGITEAALFQIQFGTEGMSGPLVHPAVMLVIKGLAPAVAGALLLLTWWALRRKKPVPASQDTINSPDRRRSLLGVLPRLAYPLSVLFLAGALVLNPGFLQSIRLLAPMGDSTALTALLHEAVRPPPPVVPAQPKSLVHIYVESLERTFSNEILFPGLMPQMGKLTPQGVDFSGITQVPFTGWTIAGQTASNCGYPGVDGVSAMTRDHKDHPCMSDLLHEAGYTQVFLMAANLKFAGEGAYFMRHGFTRAYGGADIPPMAGQPDAPKSPWGVHDDVLFSAGLKEFRRLVKAGRPFNLEILTIDTHPPHGFPSPNCPRGGYRAPVGHEILFAVHCTDASLAAFIAQLRAEMPDNVVVAVQNDHMMVNIPDTQGLLWPTVPHQVAREDRLTVWGHGLSPRVVHRRGSMFDVAPTLYGLLGFSSTPIGFGRDLLGKRPTLIEQYGQPWMVDHMRSILSLPEFRSARRTDWDRPGGLKSPGE